jgi:TetR/AcrR family transcriptional regulator
MKKPDTETTQLSRPSRRRNPEESRRRILDAAERAFALRGYAGARLRDIAQEAGVHHALVHHYYGDKRGLFDEVVRRGLSRISSAGLETLAEPPQSLENTLRPFVGVLFDFCANNKNLLRIIEGAFRDRQSVAYEATEKLLTNQVGPLLERLEAQLRLGQKAGAVRDDIPVASLLTMSFGAIVYRFITAEGLLTAMSLVTGPVDLERERENTVRYVLSGMRAPRKEPPKQT